ncbi:MAG: glutathione S-transferase family protein [Bradymonadaceae bacterium]
MTENILITIGFSHYCEKARWALDRSGVSYREEKYLPMFHLAATTRAARQRTVPILIAGGNAIADSTDILYFADREGSGAKLFPEDEALRGEVESWEEDFDRGLGPAARRLVYHHLLTAGDYSRSYMLEVSEGFQHHGMRVVFPLVRRIIQKGYRIDEAGAQRSRERIEDTFERVAQTLSDGRPYLVGDAFTAADLTFASLAAPLIFPPEHGFPLPSLSGAPPDLEALVTPLRDTTAGQFALRLYKDHRIEA